MTINKFQKLEKAEAAQKAEAARKATKYTTKDKDMVKLKMTPTTSKTALVGNEN
jgi:hypothetical protein